MSRKTRKKKREAAAPPAPPRRRRLRKGPAVLAACLLLVGVALAAARFAPVRRAVGLAPLPGPVAQGPDGLPLAKEYVYAGGRLVATEEPGGQPTPTPTPAGSPPSNLVALLESVSGASASISVSWSPPASGGQVASYIVERKVAGGSFVPVGQPVPAPATNLNDGGASEGAAYLYRVKAVFAAGGSSDYSNADLATAVAFTDDPLVGANDPQNRPATTVYARHLTELRRAVSAVHLLAGQGAVTSWGYPDPAGRVIRLEDVSDLRERLGEALPALGFTPPSYADPTLTRYVTKVKKEHFQQLRDAVK
ncbi:MAG TPA: fibronectin type III domain-containing protein [Pyrinomonadaceae bacterium]